REVHDTHPAATELALKGVFARQRSLKVEELGGGTSHDMNTIRRSCDALETGLAAARNRASMSTYWQAIEGACDFDITPRPYARPEPRNFSSHEGANCRWPVPG